MHILIADKLAPEGLEYLASRPGVTHEVRLGLTEGDLGEALRGCDGLIVRSGVRVTREALARAYSDRVAGPRLRAIARAGVGVDNIDLDAATEFGVLVLNSASASTITTAEHAFALLLSLARRVPQAHASMRAGGWDRGSLVGVQLHGRTLGVVGLGRIGQTVAERALGFGMGVIGFDPFINADTTMDGRVALLRDFDEFIARVDAVTFHVPLSDKTENMLGRAQFALARPHLLVVNAARGGVVDEGALLEALDAGRCAGAALDVYTAEPPPKDSPLRTHPKIICTPHLGASTSEAQEAVSVDACRAIVEYLRGEGVRGAVNLGDVRLDLSARERVYAELARRMARLIVALLDDAPAAVRVHVRGGELSDAAQSIGRIALAATLSDALDEPVNLVNAPLVARRRSVEFRLTREVEETGAPGLLTIEVETRAGAQRAEGVALQDNVPRLLEIDGCRVDVSPMGHMVVMRNDDTPGAVGAVGAVFGRAGLNIADMTISRRPSDPAAPTKSGTALMLVRLDEAPGREVLEELRALPMLERVASVELPG